MPTLIIPNVDHETYDFLRQRAALHGRSMEAEVRSVLSVYRQQNMVKPGDVSASIRRRFAGLGPIPEVERRELPSSGVTLHNPFDG